MKKIIFITVVLMWICSNVYAQYRPMLSEGSEWHHYFWFEGSCNHHLVVSGDTVINNKTYKIITNLKDECNYSYQTFVREDLEEKQVYIHYYDTLEMMIYDYSLMVGDTTKGTNNYTLVLDSISNTLPDYSNCGHFPELNIENPKIFYFSYPECSACGQAIWVEGIGNLSNPFYSDLGWSEGDLGDILLCHYDDTGLRDYHYVYCEEPEPCEGPVLSIENMDLEVDITVFPNPCENEVFIDFGEEFLSLESVRIYGSSGTLLDAFHYSRGQVIDMSGFQPGIFYLIFQTDKGNLKAKKLLKI